MGKLYLFYEKRFVSLGDAQDYLRAFKDMNGKYVGNRPCIMHKSKWKEREAGEVEHVYSGEGLYQKFNRP